MRLPIIFGTAAVLLLGAPALANSHMNEAQEPAAQTQERTTLNERCDRLAERFRNADVQAGVEADVLGAEVLHDRGTEACNGGNYDQGISLIQQALRDIGAPAKTQAN